jgi:PAS domain S-box-containing protein
MAAAQIMIVEADVSAASELQISLERHGYQVYANLNSAEEALARAEQAPPDLVLLDARIDDIDAAALFQSKWGVPSVLIVTATGDEELRRDRPTRPAGYLLRPVDERQLKLTIEAALYTGEVERRRRQAERDLERIEEVAQVGIWEWDLTSNRVQWSDEMYQIFGVARGEALTFEAVQELVHPEDLGILKDAVSKALQHQPAEQIEYRITRRNGTPHIVRTWSEASYDESGRLIQLRGATQDVTQRKLAEDDRLRRQQRLLQAQKRESLGVLAGGVAHEFNNLLMGILGNVELAQLELPDSSPIRSDLDEIELAAKRAADVSRQMLAFSGKGKIEPQVINLVDVVQGMRHLMRATISERIKICFDLDPNLPTVEVDVAQIQQVVMSLTTNAVEAIGGDSGAITISVGRVECDEASLGKLSVGDDQNLVPGTYVFLEVSDNGKGMEKEISSKMFDPFFSTKFTGRGLGLAAVLGIVRSHGGAISAESKPDHGTWVRALFPAQLPDAEAMSGKELPEPQEQRTTGTILVVDDERTVRAVVRRMLERIGYRVLTSADGDEAVELLRRHPDTIQGIILDLTMPRLSGEQAFRKLQRIRHDIPIIVASGYSERESMQRCAGLDPAAFIQKPFRFSTLESMLHKVFS